MTNILKGHIALFIAQIVYALNYSIAKDLMPTYIGPIALVFLRIFFLTKIGQNEENPKFKEKNNKLIEPFITILRFPGFKREAKTVNEIGNEKL